MQHVIGAFAGASAIVELANVAFLQRETRPGFIAHQTAHGPSCVIVPADAVTDRRAEFVEWRTWLGVFRVYAAAGVVLVYVPVMDQIVLAAQQVGIHAATCARGDAR